MEALATRFIKADEIVTRSIAGETIVVPVRGRVGDLDSIFTLNEVATSIWNLLDGQRDVASIVNAVSSEYEVSETDAARDVWELLTSMQSSGLIRRA